MGDRFKDRDPVGAGSAVNQGSGTDFNSNHSTVPPSAQPFDTAPFQSLIDQARRLFKADPERSRVHAAIYWALVYFVRRRHGADLHRERRP